MKYVLSGSLGHITKPLASHLIAADHEVIIISSRGERRQEITSLGASAAIGSVEDPGFLAKTFKGADAVYTMVPPKYDAPDVVAFNHTIGDNYAAAVKASGVKMIVNLSSWGAHNPAGCGPVTGMYFVEQALNALEDVHIRHLRPGFFYTNLLSFIPMIKGVGIVGNNYGPDTRLIMVSPDAIAKVAEEELISLAFSGRSIRYIASDESNFGDITAMLGKAIGRPNLIYKMFTDEEMRAGLMQAGLSQNMAENFVELGRAIRTGMMISDYLKHPVRFEGTKLTNFALEFAAAYKSQ
jgi:uncharacterized protein YbjT (DUF2867 family)